MKKRIIKLAIAGAIAIVGTVGYNFSVNQNDANFQFTIDNVEALAQGEGYEYPDGYPYYTTCNVAISAHRKCKVEVIVCQAGGNGCNSKKCPQHK